MQFSMQPQQIQLKNYYSEKRNLDVKLLSSKFTALHIHTGVFNYSLVGALVIIKVGEALLDMQEGCYLSHMTSKSCFGPHVY